MRNLTYIITALSFLISAIGYPFMPEKVAPHWNLEGEATYYMPKLWGLFLIPFIPKIDPLKENYKSFRSYYDAFVLLLLTFLLWANIQIILYNLGLKINPNFIIFIPIGLLFFYIGMILEKVKRNWFFGIRTPWTLSSDNVWNKTHKLGAKLFKVLGILSIISTFLKMYALFLILILLFGAYLIVYSYLEYEKEIKSKNA